MKTTWRVVALAAACLGISCGTTASGPGAPYSPGSGGSSPSTNGSGSSASNASGSSSSGGASSSANGGTGPGGTSTSNPSGGTSNTGGGTGGMVTVGAGGVDASANDANTATITMGSFSVPPNQEVFMCQDFPNPFGGADVAIGESESDMTPGSHHLHVFYGEDSPASLTVSACANPFEFRSLLHVAGQPHLDTKYPAGMAAKLNGSVGLRLQAHYLNTTSSAYTANVVVRLTKVDPSTITKWIAQLYFNRTVLSVPQGDGQVVTTTCTVPSTYGQISLLRGASHMHSRGVHYVANTSTGTKLVDTTIWDEPPISTYDPPITLNPGDSITWTCTYNNMTGGTLTFGDSASKNEMCIFLARFYSAPSGDDIECQSPSPNGTGMVTNNVP
jgi:hypothetical protein